MSVCVFSPVLTEATHAGQFSAAKGGSFQCDSEETVLLLLKINIFEKHMGCKIIFFFMVLRIKEKNLSASLNITFEIH